MHFKCSIQDNSPTFSFAEIASLNKNHTYRQFKEVSITVKEWNQNTKNGLKNSIQEIYYDEDIIGIVRVNANDENTSVDVSLNLKHQDFENLANQVINNTQPSLINLTVDESIQSKTSNIFYWSQTNLYSKEWKLNGSLDILPIRKIETIYIRDSQPEVDEYDKAEEQDKIATQKREAFVEDLDSVINSSFHVNNIASQSYEIKMHAENLKNQVAKIRNLLIGFILIFIVYALFKH